MIRRSKHGFSHLLDAISAPRLKCFRVSGSRGSTFGRFGGTELGRNRSGRSLRSITRSSCHLEIASGKKCHHQKWQNVAKLKRRCFFFVTMMSLGSRTNFRNLSHTSAELQVNSCVGSTCSKTHSKTCFFGHSKH